MHTLLVNSKKKKKSDIGGHWQESAFTLFSGLYEGRAMVQAVSRWHRIAYAALCCRANPREICYGQSGTGVCPGTSVYLCQCNFSNTTYLSSFSWCSYQESGPNRETSLQRFPFRKSRMDGRIVMFALVVWQFTLLWTSNYPRLWSFKSC
jgi:hypothetical protein